MLTRDSRLFCDWAFLQHLIHPYSLQSMGWLVLRGKPIQTREKFMYYLELS